MRAALSLWPYTTYANTDRARYLAARPQGGFIWKLYKQKFAERTMIAGTPRLILRELEPADAPALHAVFSEPEAIRFALRVHANVGETRNWVTAVRNGYVKNGFGPWAIMLKDDGSVIGYSGCSLIKVNGQWEHELGYRVLPSHWGRGYATEATAAARDYGFDHLDLSRLVAVIQPGNAASVRVAEKIGMAYEKDIVFENMPASLFAIHKGKNGEPAHAADCSR